MKDITDYTDPLTVDVDFLVANIYRQFEKHGSEWDDSLRWPNITVMALAAEIRRLRERASVLHEVNDAENGCWLAYHGDFSGLAVFSEEVDALRYAVENSMKVSYVLWGEELREQTYKPNYGGV